MPLDRRSLIAGTGAAALAIPARAAPLSHYGLDAAHFGLRPGAPADQSARSLFDTSGTGVEIGAVWRPNLQPYRIGIAFRSAIDTQPSFNRNLLPTDTGDLVVGSNGSSLASGSASITDVITRDGFASSTISSRSRSGRRYDTGCGIAPSFHAAMHAS